MRTATKGQSPAGGATVKRAPPPAEVEGGIVPAVGWREYVALPDLGLERIKAKVDTGARTSALHAVNIDYFVRQGVTFVSFEVHPKQRDSKRIVHCEAPLVEERYVRDSGGKRTLRPVIETVVVLASIKRRVELTLVGRSTMGFRMLIGRQALRGQFLVDPGKSYLGGRPPKAGPKTDRAVLRGKGKVKP